MVAKSKGSHYWLTSHIWNFMREMFSIKWKFTTCFFECFFCVYYFHFSLKTNAYQFLYKSKNRSTVSSLLLFCRNNDCVGLFITTEKIEIICHSHSPLYISSEREFTANFCNTCLFYVSSILYFSRMPRLPFSRRLWLHCFVKQRFAFCFYMLFYSTVFIV